MVFIQPLQRLPFCAACRSFIYYIICSHKKQLILFIIFLFFFTFLDIYLTWVYIKKRLPAHPLAKSLFTIIISYATTYFSSFVISSLRSVIPA